MAKLTDVSCVCAGVQSVRWVCTSRFYLAVLCFVPVLNPQTLVCNDAVATCARRRVRGLPYSPLSRERYIGRWVHPGSSN